MEATRWLAWVLAVWAGDLAKAALDLSDFMEDLYLPPFWVGRGDCIPPGFQLATDQIQNATAAILVCKDLSDKPDGEIQPLQPARDGFLFWPL